MRTDPPMNKISIPRKKASGNGLPPLLRGQGGKMALTRHQTCQHLDPGLPSHQDCEKYIPPSLWRCYSSPDGLRHLRVTAGGLNPFRPAGDSRWDSEPEGFCIAG